MPAADRVIEMCTLCDVVSGSGASTRFGDLATRLLTRPRDAGSLAARFRAARWQLLSSYLPDLAELDVLDLGGTVGAWRLAPVRPKSLTLLNLAKAPIGDEPWARICRGDACDPDVLAGERFDLVYSNSVIEHVGGYLRRITFAETVHRLASRHWIQTPYRYFPIEPHAVFPALQFLPLHVRAAIVRHWPIGNVRYGAGRRPLRDIPFEHAVRAVCDIELLTATEMRLLFPHSQLERERILGLTKSLIAVR